MINKKFFFAKRFGKRPPKDRQKFAKGSPNGDAPFWAKIENCMFLGETDVLRNKIKLYSFKKVIEIKK